MFSQKVYSHTEKIEYYNYIKNFHLKNGIETHWFPGKVDMKPVVPEKLEHGEIKIKKSLKSIKRWIKKDVNGVSVYEGHPLYFQGKMKNKTTGEEYDDYTPTMRDWDRFTEDQILARQELLKDPVWSKIFNCIFLKTDDANHIDIDCPLVNPLYIDLLGKCPYYRSSTKSYGCQIFIRSDTKAPKNRQSLINDVDSDITQEIELLAGQWAYLPIGREIVNYDIEIPEFDFSKLLMQTLKDVKLTNKKVKSSPTPSESSVKTEVCSYNNTEQLRELVSLIKCNKEIDGIDYYRQKLLNVCDSMKGNGLTEGDWLLFCKNNELSMNREKKTLWGNVKGANEVYYLYKLAKESAPEAYAEFVKKYNIQLMSGDEQKFLDEQEAKGLLESKADIFKTTKYKNAKSFLEQKIFKLETPLSYVSIDPNEDSSEIWFYTQKQLELYCRGKKELPSLVLCKKAIQFVNFWQDDFNHRIYNKLVFETNPSKYNKINYNLFTGFSNDKGKTPINEDESKFLQLLKKHCQQPDIYEFVKCWIAHIIQKPWEKSCIALILYSKLGGVGKNCLVDGIKAIIGKKYCGQLQSIKDITKTFNSHLCNKLFIYGDEVCGKAKELTDFLKNIVSRTECTLEKKNVDPFQVSDVVNYLFTTNNEHCFKTDETDRRMSFIRCLEERMSSQESIAFYEEINDTDKVQQLFEFFKTYKQKEIEGVPEFKIGQGQSALITSYKQELIFEDRKPFIAMLYKDTNTFAASKITSTFLHQLAVDYARKNYQSSSFTITEMGTAMTKYLGSIKKRTNTGYMFVFPPKHQFLKMLYEVDEPYYRYIFQLKDEDQPKFKDDDEHDNTILDF